MSDPELPERRDEAVKLLRTLAQAPPANPHVDSNPWGFLRRLYDRRGEAFIRPLLHELVRDDDPRVRACALYVLTVFPEKPETLDVLLRAATEEPARYRDAVIDGVRLVDSMQQALVTLSRRGRERDVVGALRLLVGDELPAASAVGIIGQFDPDWALAIAARHAAAQPDPYYWESMAGRMAQSQRDRLLELLRALGALPRQSRELLLAGVLDWLRTDEAAIRLLAEQDGLPPPTRPAPTEAECRAALGL